MLRKQVWAGKFYPSSERLLLEQIESFLTSKGEKTEAIGIVVPHAGYVYSGPVAGAVYSRVKLPNRFIIASPNHWDGTTNAAVDTSDSWETPLGTVEVDNELAELITTNTERIKPDRAAHIREHAIEVQLPFIQYFLKNDFKFAPVSMLSQSYDILEEISGAFVKAVKSVDDPVMLIASTDMSHYISQEKAEKLDNLAIERMLALDPKGLYEVVRKNGISMCGLPAVVAVLAAAIGLGCKRADLVKYATSGDTSGDYEEVVGYAGVIFH